MIVILLDEGLKTTTDKKLTITDKKAPNDCPLNANANSNHPPTILKQLPKMVTIRLSSSINDDEFSKAKALCENNLKSNGFNNNVKIKSILITH